MDLLDNVKQKATAQFDSQKGRATDGLSAIAHAVRGRNTHRGGARPSLQSCTHAQAQSDVDAGGCGIALLARNASRSFNLGYSTSASGLTQHSSGVP